MHQDRFTNSYFEPFYPYLTFFDYKCGAICFIVDESKFVSLTYFLSEQDLKTQFSCFSPFVMLFCACMLHVYLCVREEKGVNTLVLKICLK